MGQCQSIPTEKETDGKIGIRYSLRELERLFDTNEDPKKLEDLMTAWEGIKAMEPEDLKSFFNLAGYHGEPFVGSGSLKSDEWWGGYCNHGNVLFPTWHRAYVLKLEEALQSVVPGVMMAYWDATSSDSLKFGIPHSLTDEYFTYKTQFDGNGTPRKIINPLRSYTFQLGIEDAKDNHNQYTKPRGYETKRYPLSGLYGTLEAKDKSDEHNAKYPNFDENVQLLNKNVVTWLNGGFVEDTSSTPITPEDNDDEEGGGEEKVSDNGSVRKFVKVKDQFEKCLSAKTYTLFSNTSSAKHYNDNNKNQVVALETPHNSLHLAIGGFDINDFEAGLLTESNGDMGENNTAAFDPIFFFHHCNIDRVFWLWQKKHKCKKWFDIDDEDIGANSDTLALGGQGPVVNFEKDMTLTMDTPLTPFMIDKTTQFYTSRDVIDVRKLGYKYSKGSLEDHVNRRQSQKKKNLSNASGTVYGHGKKLKVSGINRALFAGSFVVSVFAEDVDGRKYHIGYEPVLSRWNVEGCMNCQKHLEVVGIFSLENLSEETIERATFSVSIIQRGEQLPEGLRYSFEVVV